MLWTDVVRKFSLQRNVDDEADKSRVPGIFMVLTLLWSERTDVIAALAHP